MPFYGAITRVAASDMAFALRQPGYELDIMGRWSAPAEKASAVRWLRALRDNLQPFAHGVYVNQLGETSDELVRRRTGRTTLAWWRSRKSTTPRMCCGSTRTSSRIGPRIIKKRRRAALTLTGLPFEELNDQVVDPVLLVDVRECRCWDGSATKSPSLHEALPKMCVTSIFELLAAQLPTLGL